MRDFRLICSLTITLISLLGLGCSSSHVSTSAALPEPNNSSVKTSSSSPNDWKTIDDPKWGFRIDVPSTLQDKNFEGKDLWVHENAQMRVIVDFGKVSSQAELSRKKNSKQTVVQVNDYDAVIYTYNEQSNPQKQQFNKVATLIFQESPKSYGAGKPPVFRVEYVSENDLEEALKILQTVRFYES
jgi:hypothetical protein